MGRQHGNLPASGIFRRLLDCSDDTKALAKSTTAGIYSGSQMSGVQSDLTPNPLPYKGRGLISKPLSL
jgi:hypothetical protein